MSFLTGHSDFQAQPATGNTQFQAQNLQPAINTAQTGVQNQIQQANGIVGQQGDLASQLLAQSQGQGPNIAAMQLKQATDRNNQQAAGSIASQRGMNPALAARLIAQNQAANNQTAAGQSGLLRAEQQLSAQGQLANVYGQQANESLAGGQLQNANLGVNETALNNQNNQVVGATNAANQINAQTAEQNAGGLSKFANGLLGGLGGALTSGVGALTGAPSASAIGNEADTELQGNWYKWKGGEIGHYDDGGTVTQPAPDPDKVKAFLEGFNGQKKSSGGPIDYRNGGNVGGTAKVSGDSPQNDTVPAMLSPGEVVLPRSVTKSQNPEQRAKEFMAALKKHKQDEDGPKGFAKVLDIKRKIKEVHGHLDDLHKMVSK